MDEPYDFQTWHSNAPVVKDEKKDKKHKKEAAKAEKKSKKEVVTKKKSKKGKRKQDSEDEKEDTDEESDSSSSSDSDSSSSDSDIDSDNDDPNTMPPPKSKKKKVRKGKNSKKKAAGEEGDDEAQAPENEDDTDGSKKKKKSGEKKDGSGRKGEYGVWIGNLSFLTTDKALRHFFKDVGAEITRVNLPKGHDKRNKGFAYVDFESQEGQENAIAMSEKELDGRKVLIKSSKSFSGRPMVSKTEVTDKSFKQKHSESPTLFVGNLSFNSTRESLKALFEDAGEIRKVRLATFEDTGKCKGFAYIDYTEADSATKALRDPKKHYLDGRRLKVEYASADATLRGNPRMYRKHLREQEGGDAAAAAAAEGGEHTGAGDESTRKRSADGNPDEQRAKRQRRPRGEQAPKKLQGHQRPGFALAMAQRASQGIQEFKGTKMTFDN